jgi:hypothetical protein
MHADEEYCEVVVGRGDDPLSTTPETLGHLLKVTLTPGSNAISVPPRLKAQLDTIHRPEVFPLVVPQTIAAQPAVPAPAPNVSAPSCRALLARSRLSCGEMFRCSPQCNTDFGEYFNKCLAKTLQPIDHDRVLKQFKEFFRLCEVCTTDRARSVKNRCGLSANIKNNLPSKCSLVCANSFLPYYEECLRKLIQYKLSVILVLNLPHHSQLHALLNVLKYLFHFSILV